MTPHEIYALVFEVLGVWVQGNSSQKNDAMDARYIVIVMLHEEAISHREIAGLLNRDRTCIYYNLKTIDGFLKHNKEFKSKYLQCIARMAQIETQNEEN